MFVVDFSVVRQVRKKMQLFDLHLKKKDWVLPLMVTESWKFQTEIWKRKYDVYKISSDLWFGVMVG